MTRNQKISANGSITFLLLLINVLVMKNGFIIHEKWYLLLPGTIPMLAFSIALSRRKNTGHF